MTNRSLSGQRIRPEEWLLIACILFTFLWRFVAMLWIPALYPLNDYFPMLWAALAACLARRGQTWRRKSVWILGAGLGLIFLRCLFGGMETLQGGLKAVSGGVLAFGVCYQTAFGLRKEALLSFLRLLLGLWTALATLLSLAGLWAALYDQVLSTPMGGVYVLGLQDNRLNLLTYCTDSASLLTLSLLAAVTGLLMTRRTPVRILYALCCVVLFVTLSLTVTRTAFITLGLSLGLVAACAALTGLRKVKAVPRWCRRALCLLLVAVFTVGMYQALNYTLELFNGAKVHLRAAAEETLVPLDEVAPPAETEAPAADAGNVETLSQRPIQLDSSILSGRQYVWLGALRVLQSNPWYLLYGISVVQPMLLVNPLTGVELSYYHMHCMYLQVLVECGIPGLILLMMFLWRFARCAWKLMRDGSKPLWMRTLPVLPICILVAELVECLTLLSFNNPVLPFLLLFMGMTVRFAEDPKDLIRGKERA